ncbi:hypothetical protein NBCG_05327 [Nocardioidaceae bacterium Broad-1]|nr:hypothetical protein NBCG_05327 [Nocardioidaceae bacterium Broad-1]
MNVIDGASFVVRTSHSIFVIPPFPLFSGRSPPRGAGELSAVDRVTTSFAVNLFVPMTPSTASTATPQTDPFE